jgi:hypothetical protein
MLVRARAGTYWFESDKKHKKTQKNTHFYKRELTVRTGTIIITKYRTRSSLIPYSKEFILLFSTTLRGILAE